jgi:hypothetical protein
LPLLRNIMIALVLNTDSKASLLTSSQTFLWELLIDVLRGLK